MNSILLPQKEAAARLGVSLDQLRTLVDEQRLRFVLVGKTKLFAESELENFAHRETEKCQFIDERTPETGSSVSIGQMALGSKKRSRQPIIQERKTLRPWNEKPEPRENQGRSDVSYDLAT